MVSKRMFVILILLFLFSFSLSAMTLRDALGREVTIKSVRRVISLAPSISETVCLINCSVLVGVDNYSNWPPKVSNITKVGSFWNPSFEKIAELKPDVVIADAGAHYRLLNFFKKFRINVFFVKGDACHNVTCVERDILTIGKLLGNVTRSKLLIKWIEGNLTEARDFDLHLKVLILFYPFFGSVWGVGNQTFISDALARVGLQNIVQLKGWIMLNKEYLLSLKPDLVLLITTSKYSPKKVSEDLKKVGITAKEVCEVYGTVGDMIQRPSPRLGKGVLNIVEAIVKGVSEDCCVFCFPYS